MTIQAIYKKAVNNGYEVKTVTTNSGKYAIIVEGWNTPDFYNCIHSIYRKCNVHIDFHYATKSAYIMDNADYEADRAYNIAKTDLNIILMITALFIIITLNIPTCLYGVQLHN